MNNLSPYKSQNLHIIKASAGSGKTHRLTGEYLHLLFYRPNNHRHILAVTFTNKATDEMKSRIVEELHRLSSGEKSDYLNKLMSDFSLNKSDVRIEARRILKTILHDYSSFSISTIDRFFQQVMRAFAREIGHTGGYNIEVDHSPFLMEAVDLMLSELDRSENKEVLDWLLQFMQNSIEEGRSWRINRDIAALSKELFNETYKSFTTEEQEAFQNKNQLSEYKKELVEIINKYEKKLKGIGDNAVSIMENNYLEPSDFKGGSRSQFFKLAQISKGDIPLMTNTFIGLPDNIKEWYTRTTTRDIISKIEKAYDEGLNKCIKQVIGLYQNNTEYATAKCILQNFYTLGILNDIKIRLKNILQENNTLLISDTTEILNDIIAGADSPFIYEKIGTKITNYMIDEFQDTSGMQWANFKPLIEESLDSGNFNLIVGDVKQSIYRFRNSDWRLLEKQVEEDLSGMCIDKHVLDTNWRSDTKIVEFNNSFFKKAASTLQDHFNNPNSKKKNNSYTQITDAYVDVHQHLPKKKKADDGYVKITFLKENKDSDWREEALNRLPGEIESLQDQGFALKDIAIVVRWNREAVMVAEKLLSYKEEHPDSRYRYDIISNEALIIGSSQSVKSAIALMRHFINSNDKLHHMTAVYEFLKYQYGYSPDEALKAYQEETNGDFPDEFRDKIAELTSMSFYDMIEGFFSLFTHNSDEKESAYIQAFLDIALQFSKDKSSDLNAFIDWWDEKGSKKTLYSPEEQNAIRIITIHKSKGLGFGAVIMPFVNWSLDHTSNKDIIWCKPDRGPFNKLSVVPLRYSNKLSETIFKEDYLEEKIFTYIDNLNLLYVAFTRAKHRLILFTPLSKKADRFSDVSDLIRETVINAQFSQESISEHETECLFELGNPNKISLKSEKQSLKSYKTSNWNYIPFDDRLKLRLSSIGYFSDNGSRYYGKLMHDIVSNVKTISDIPKAIDKKISEGELNENERENLTNKLTNYLSIPNISDWYSGKYNVLNEAQVLHLRKGVSRPDRVMIGHNRVIVVDYKFGESEDRKHYRQVQRYVKSIQGMGYPNVEGYVFYVKAGKVKSV